MLVLLKPLLVVFILKLLQLNAVSAHDTDRCLLDPPEGVRTVPRGSSKLGGMVTAFCLDDERRPYKIVQIPCDSENSIKVSDYPVCNVEEEEEELEEEPEPSTSVCTLNVPSGISIYPEVDVLKVGESVKAFCANSPDFAQLSCHFRESISDSDYPICRSEVVEGRCNLNPPRGIGIYPVAESLLVGDSAIAYCKEGEIQKNLIDCTSTDSITEDDYPKCTQQQDVIYLGLKGRKSQKGRKKSNKKSRDRNKSKKNKSQVYPTSRKMVKSKKPTSKTAPRTTTNAAKLEVASFLKSLSLNSQKTKTAPIKKGNDDKQSAKSRFQSRVGSRKPITQISAPASAPEDTRNEVEDLLDGLISLMT